MKMVDLFFNVLGVILTFLGICVALAIALGGFFYWRNRRLGAAYEVIWKRSKNLRPEELLGIRGQKRFGFRSYYMKRKENDLIEARLNGGKNVLAIGMPLAGKTRMVVETLRRLQGRCYVLVPKLVDVDPEKMEIPGSWRWGGKKIVVLDDLNKFVQQKNFQFFLQELLKTGWLLVATCRKGSEFDFVSSRMETQLSTIFGEPILVPSISKEEAAQVASQTDVLLPDRFDGNIGSIFLKLDAMQERFNRSDEREKSLLRALKRLFYAGLYDERGIFAIDKMKKVCKHVFEFELPQYQWLELLNGLIKKDFMEKNENSLKVEETYLESIFTDDFSILNNFQTLTDLFAGDFEALLKIASTSYNSGLVDLDKIVFMEKAIAAYEEALKVRTVERFPMDYATTQNNLGNAYRTLAEVERKTENCKKAIAAYEEALKVFTEEAFPEVYRIVVSNFQNIAAFCEDVLPGQPGS